MGVSQETKHSTRPRRAAEEPPAAPAGASAGRDLAILGVLVVVLLAPFLAKSVHIDEPLFVWCAKHLRTDPVDFYNFPVNWYGVQQPMYMVTQNPPLASYYLAAAGAVFGWSEVALHCAMLVPALAATAGVYCLARRMCGRPLLAAALMVATPAFVASSTTLMCDVSMLALWIWAVIAWLKGCDERRPAWLYVAALLVVLAALTKYYAVCLIPLLIASTVYRETFHAAPRRGKGAAPASKLAWGHVAAALSVAIGALVAYELATRSWYGVGLLSKAFSYPFTTIEREFELGRQSLVALAMFGGCLPVALVASGWLWGRRAALGVLIATIAVSLVLLVPGAIEQCLGNATILPAWIVAPQVAAFWGAGALALFLAGHAAWRHRDEASVLLALWLLGTYAFAGYVNWSTNCRSVLPAAPALAILVVRQIERRAARQAAGGAAMSFHWQPAALVLPTALMALAVAWADMEAARSPREAAFALVKDYSDPPPLFYEGHWGFQYYLDLQPLPANPLDMLGTPIRQGSHLAIPFNNTNIKKMPDTLVEKVLDYRSPACSFAATNFAGTAGLYSSEFGPLPYVFGPMPSELYCVYRAKQNFAVQPAPEDPRPVVPPSPAYEKFQRLYLAPQSQPAAPAERPSP